MLGHARKWLTAQGVTPELADWMTTGIALGLLLVLCVAANAVAKRIILRLIRRFVVHTETTWDDAFVKRRVFHRLSHFAPATVIFLGMPVILEAHQRWADMGQRAALIYLVVIALLAIDATLNAVLDIYRTYPIARKVPVKGFLQVTKVVIVFLGGIVVLSVVLDKTPVYLLSGLGALTAVLLFVFKDVILGLIAGIQLLANKMVAPGDWIEMPKYGADGDVLEVALTTVKVRNWDKTVTTIPTYALISESFKNWRGMAESGGRRIKRSIYIDLSSIKFCTPEMLERFAKFQHLSHYIAEKKEAVLAYNKKHGFDPNLPVSGRRLTNIGTLRAYVVAYLRHHPMVNEEMTFLVRQLAPTATGLPLEIYIFCRDKVWANYETIQADIFDHILAIVPSFDLRLFQKPSGFDFRRATASLAT